MQENDAKMLTTIERAFEIVELIMDLDGARVTEVADQLDIPKSTAHNYVSTLNRQGYLDKEGNQYRIGLKFLNPGGHAAATLPAYQLLRAKVNALAEETNERAQLIVLNHGKGIYVYEMHGTDAVQTDVRIGKRVGLHTTSAGKAILADLPDERVERVIDRMGLPRRTEHTITDRGELWECLGEVRDRGYAFNDEERIAGQRAVGVAITGKDGVATTALSVSGPMNRLRGDRFREEMPNTLLGMANEVELNIQFS